MRIAILTHSTNPRGSVVHGLELAEALVRLGHDAVVHAPDPQQNGFFRSTICQTIGFPATPATKNLADLVATRRREYRQYFQRKSNRAFDVFHAQDSISANGLADLKAGTGLRFARTVHHLDHFEDPALMALQARGVAAADRHFVVSRQGQDQLARQFGVQAGIVGNGVDTARYAPVETAQDAILRASLGLGSGPVLLAIGGIEERKNTIRTLQAFQIVRARHGSTQLVIAGGASLLDHDAYRQAFGAMRREMQLPETAIRITGPLPQSAMPALYRAADALIFPSVREGFGIAVLEAAACGTPIVTSRMPPFTEYLADDDVAWCDPYDFASIAQAILSALDPRLRAKLIARGHRMAARHDWGKTAAAHLQVYEQMQERAPAATQDA